MNTLAQEIAQLLDRDPITASQIQEHLKPERLREVLDLPETAPKVPEYESNNDLVDACIQCGVPLSTIIAAYNKSGGLHG